MVSPPTNSSSERSIATHHHESCDVGQFLHRSDPWMTHACQGIPTGAHECSLVPTNTALVLLLIFRGSPGRD